MLKSLHCWLIVSVFVVNSAISPAAEPRSPGDWGETRVLPAPEARQAVAAFGPHVYAIDNKVVARYDRSTGKRLAISTGSAHHLNSGFIHEGKLYAAHSNYPMKPEKSEIKVLDLETMQLNDFKSFENSSHGSLTVVLFHDQAWWCVFARYGKENAQTVLVKFDRNWNEQGVWTFPQSVIADLGKMSISGGVWKDAELLATGHDKPVLYRLRVPDQGNVLIHNGTVKTPFPGQGIAVDPETGGLVGIDRKQRCIVFAEPLTKS